MPLYRDEFAKSLLLGQGIGFGQLPGKAVGNADGAHLACLYDAIEAIHDFIERRSVIPHMIDIQIHIIHPQMLQAPIQQIGDMLLAADAGGDLLGGAGHDLVATTTSSRLAKSRRARPTYCSLVPF